MTLVLAILLTVGCVAAIFHPLLTGRAAPLGAMEDEVTDVQHRKRMALISLRDVEYDFHAGKLDETDYRALKAQVSAEALAALDDEARELARLGGASGGSGGMTSAAQADVEAEIAALRASIRHGVICTQCGHPNPRASRFCGECGAAITVVSASGGPPA
ncbi:hypothetical protein BH23GEM11_BH23GEM11_14520 [soil metagenome]